MRVLIFGNSGSGKTTLAQALAREHGLAHLDLDRLAWSAPAVRKPLEESAAEIRYFLGAHDAWVVEGCYGDLLALVLPSATEVRFLNPGIDVCVANCRARPWEPEKYDSKEEQDGRLGYLLEWVRAHETRPDEYSLARHRQLYESFRGRKQEVTCSASRVSRG
jgi:adenylate kinase family enzyme